MNSAFDLLKQTGRNIAEINDKPVRFACAARQREGFLNADRAIEVKDNA